MVLGGCAGRPSQGVLVPTAQVAPGNTNVPIYVVTNRKRSDADPGEMFSGDRSDELSFAEVTVSIPPDASRKIGEVQWPASLPGDPQRDFTTVSADYLDKTRFAASVTAAMKQSGRNKVLVFVHGFNNRFDDAVYRFAQIVHDSKVPVVPVLFTWPSRGELRLRAYTYDRESANFSRDALDNPVEHARRLACRRRSLSSGSFDGQLDRAGSAADAGDPGPFCRVETQQAEECDAGGTRCGCRCLPIATEPDGWRAAADLAVRLA